MSDQTPHQHVIDLAVEVAVWSPCRSKRGVVVFTPHGDVVSHGHNYKPRGFDCDQTDACKATCRVEAVHAEQQALLHAGMNAKGSDLLHVKIVNGALVPSGGPSCVQCSKLAVVCGISGVWLFHDTGWTRYGIAEFHQRSLDANTDVIATLTARCEALTAERDRLAVAICPSGSVGDVIGLEALAQAHRIDSEGVDEYLDTGDETNLSGAYHAGAQAIRSRCQHLEQNIRVVLPNVESYYDACDAAVQALWAIIESSEKAIPPTDENRVSFAAGYSTLVDDHAALLKDMRELMSQAYLACGDMQDDIVERAVLRLGLDPFDISKIPEGEDRD